MQRILKEKVGLIPMEIAGENNLVEKVVQSKDTKDTSKVELDLLVDAVKRKSEAAMKTKKGKRKLN